LNKAGGQLDNPIALEKMPLEMPENRSALGGRKVAIVLSAGDRGSDLDGGDASDVKGMPGLGTHEGFNPNTV
jgi:hypothetical protein